MDQEKFGNLIKKIRKDNNLTQKEFADKYNVTYQAVSKRENGINLPDMSLLKKMSEDYELDATPYVCDNSLKIANMIEDINIAPTKLYIPTETFLKDKKLEVLEGKNITRVYSWYDVYDKVSKL